MGKEARIKASQSLQILEDCDQAQECLFTSPSPSNPPATKSSNASRTQDSREDNNGNTTVDSGAHHRHKNYTKEMEENIANGNVGDGVTNGNITHNSSNTHQEENILNGNLIRPSPDRYNSNNGNNGNINCFKAILSEQDSANANLPL